MIYVASKTQGGILTCSFREYILGLGPHLIHKLGVKAMASNHKSKRTPGLYHGWWDRIRGGPSYFICYFTTKEEFEFVYKTHYKSINNRRVYLQAKKKKIASRALLPKTLKIISDSKFI